MADSLVSRFGCYTIIWDTTLAAVISRRRLRSNDQVLGQRAASAEFH
jgi:predicted secreted protein